jgi:hypothetical protein
MLTTVSGTVGGQLKTGFTVLECLLCDNRLHVAQKGGGEINNEKINSSAKSQKFIHSFIYLASVI